MDQKELVRLKLIVDMIMCKKDIALLRTKDQGYDWWHLEEKDRAILVDVENRINEELSRLGPQYES